jgi:hypothetical protein
VGCALPIRVQLRSREPAGQKRKHKRRQATGQPKEEEEVYLYRKMIDNPRLSALPSLVFLVENKYVEIANP